MGRRRSFMHNYPSEALTHGDQPDFLYNTSPDRRKPWFYATADKIQQSLRHSCATLCPCLEARNCAHINYGSALAFSRSALQSDAHPAGLPGRFLERFDYRCCTGGLVRPLFCWLKESSLLSGRGASGGERGGRGMSGADGVGHHIQLTISVRSREAG